jgi:rhomboid protease GluP
MPNPDAQRYLPWATIVLIGLNLAMFAVELATGGDLMWGPTPEKAFELGANFGPVTLDGEPWRLFTSMFLHFGIIHLASNMIFGLWFVGRIVEAMYGRPAYLAVYLVAGLAGSLASAIRANAVSAGASGAIFGVMGAFAAFLIAHRDRIDPEERKRQIQSVGTMIVLNIIIGLQMKGIDMGAHVGGLIGGFIAAYALEWRRRGGRSRMIRVALVGVIGTAAVVGASFVAKPRLSGEMQQAQDEIRTLIDVEKRVLPRYAEIFKDESLDDDARAKAIETEILPPWIAAQEAYKGSPGANATLLQYLAIRRDAWTQMAAALRAKDQAAFDRSMARMNEADVLVQKLNAASP